MQIEVHGQNLEVTDALRDYSQDKMSRLERHVPAGHVSSGIANPAA